MRLRSTLAAAALALVCARASSQIAGTPALGPHGMVATSSPPATQVGVEVLRAGGNAADAAVAVGFALAVTHPEAGNLGGGGFAVLRLAGGIEVALDFRETAPASADPDQYKDEAGRVVPKRSLVGGLAAGVPGSVAGLCTIAKRYGTWPLAKLIAPAAKLAREGFLLPQELRLVLEGRDIRELLSSFPESKRIFIMGAARLDASTPFLQPELAHTLDLIAASGPDVFYRGEIADLIVAEVRRAGGTMTKEDLAGYQVKDRRPLTGSYRDYNILTMPPPSSGGVALLEALGILEEFPVRDLKFGSEAGMHVMAETLRRVFKDRASWMGDPDFAWIPSRSLVSKPYVKRLAKQIAEDATPSDIVDLPDPLATEKGETTHFSVVDGRGNAVAITTTLNGAFGSGVTVTGAGFLLNNEIDDFAMATDQANSYGLIQSVKNLVGPGKRPLSSMTPAIVTKNDSVVLVVGSPGGPTIISTVLQIVVNVVDHQMTVSQAVAAPRIHHQWLPDRLDVEPAFPPEILEGLRERGHKVTVRGRPGAPSYQGDAQVIGRQNGQWAGASDPRHGGFALGW